MPTATTPTGGCSSPASCRDGDGDRLGDVDECDNPSASACAARRAAPSNTLVFQCLKGLAASESGDRGALSASTSVRNVGRCVSVASSAARGHALRCTADAKYADLGLWDANTHKARRQL